MKSRVPVYSVNYPKMIKEVLTKRTSKSSWFICKETKDFYNGVYADLFVLGNIVEDDFQIQLWQILGNGDEVFYAHGIVNINSQKFEHFDLASHYVDPDLIPSLINDKKRIKVTKKVKWIRLDYEFDYKIAFELIKIFFPLDHLVDEFTEISVSSAE